MTKDKAQILQKLNLYRKNPDLYKDLSNAELADLVITVMGAVQIIDSAIKEGRLDGYTPKADKDYLSLETAKKELKSFESEIKSEIEAERKKKALELETKVITKLNTLKNGENGIVTDAEIERAAELALELLELPDFDSLVEERITANPMAVRDSLETIVDEKEKLEQSAIKNLPEDIRQLQEQIARMNIEIKGGVGTSKNTIDYMINKRLADGTIGINVETPSGTANGSNTNFTVSNTPKYVVVNTLTYFEGGGYSYSGGTITFDIPPVSGSVIRSIY